MARKSPQDVFALSGIEYSINKHKKQTVSAKKECHSRKAVAFFFNFEQTCPDQPWINGRS